MNEKKITVSLTLDPEKDDLRVEEGYIDPKIKIPDWWEEINPRQEGKK